MDDEAKELLRDIRDAVIRQEQQRKAFWLVQTVAIVLVIAYVIYLKISGQI